MVEDFEQDDWDMIDPSARRVLVALSEFESGLLVKVDIIHKKTGLMPEGLNDALRHLSKAKLINNPDPSKTYGPYDFLRRRNNRPWTPSAREIRVKLFNF